MHHNDAPGLDPRTDITDLYVFQKPGDPSKSILILNVNSYGFSALTGCLV
jgi:hypothetical protein